MAIGVTLGVASQQAMVFRAHAEGDDIRSMTEGGDEPPSLG